VTPPALVVADWLADIAAHLLAVDHPRGDWFAEAIALTRTGVPLDQALGWGAYQPVLRERAQTSALVAMVAAMPAGTATAAAVCNWQHGTQRGQRRPKSRPTVAEALALLAGQPVEQAPDTEGRKKLLRQELAVLDAGLRHTVRPLPAGWRELPGFVRPRRIGLWRRPGARPESFDEDPITFDQIKVVNNSVIVVFGSYSGTSQGKDGPVRSRGRWTWTATEVRSGEGWKIAASMVSTQQ
jgi:hypothetical protein